MHHPRSSKRTVESVCLDRARFRRKVAGSLLVLLLATACTPVAVTPAPTTPSPEPISTTSNRTPDAESPACQWLIQANELRARRISSALPVGNWILKYTGNDAPEIDEAAMADFVGILKVHRPNVASFLDAWKRLGLTPDSEDAWSQELEANEMQLHAMDAIIQGFESDDWDMLEEGWEGLIQAAPEGREAEAALYEIMSQCGF